MLQLESAQKDKIIVKFSLSKITQTFLNSLFITEPKNSVKEL